MSNWLKTVQKYKSLRQPGEWWCPSILLGSTDLTWAIPESKSGKTLPSIRTALYNSEVTPIDRQILWWRLNHLSQYVSFMKMLRLFCTKFHINNLKWFPIPKEQTSPPSYGKKLFLDAAGLLSPDQLWIMGRTGLWWSRSQWRSYNSIGLPINLAKWVCQVRQRR